MEDNAISENNDDLDNYGDYLVSEIIKIMGNSDTKVMSLSEALIDVQNEIQEINKRRNK